MIDLASSHPAFSVSISVPVTYVHTYIHTYMLVCTYIGIARNTALDMMAMKVSIFR